MGEVHDDAQFVHAPHDLDPEVGEAAVHPLGTAAAEAILRVVGELDAAGPEFVERIQVLEHPLEHGGVLEAEQHRHLPLRLRPLDVGGGSGVDQLVRIFPDAAAPLGERPRRYLEVRAGEGGLNPGVSRALDRVVLHLVPFVADGQRIDDHRLVVEGVDRGVPWGLLSGLLEGQGGCTYGTGRRPE